MGLIDTLLGHASEKNLDKIAEDFLKEKGFLK